VGRTGRHLLWAANGRNLYLKIHVKNSDCKFHMCLLGALKNDGHENDGPSKLQDTKMQDMKLQEMKLQDMTRIDSVLFNFSFFSCILMLTLQQWNCVT